MMIDASGLINGVRASKLGGMLVMYTKGGLVVVVGEKRSGKSVGIVSPAGRKRRSRSNHSLWMTP